MTFKPIILPDGHINRELEKRDMTTTTESRLATMRHRLESAKAELESERQDGIDMGVGMATTSHWLLDSISDVLDHVEAMGPVVESLMADAKTDADAFDRPVEGHCQYDRAQDILAALESLVDRTVGEAG